MTVPTTALPVSLTVRQVAKLLGVSVPTVWRRDSAGMIPRPVRHGHCTRWLLADIEAWLATGCPDRITFELQRGLTQ